LEVQGEDRKFQDFCKFKKSSSVYVEMLAQEDTHSKACSDLFLAQYKKVFQLLGYTYQASTNTSKIVPQLYATQAASPSPKDNVFVEA
jgi:hypothetical protein